MSAVKPAQRLELECGAVTGLRVQFAVVVLLSLCCILLLSLPLSVVLLLLMANVVLAWRCWRKRCELGASSVTLVWDAEGRWWWSQDGEETVLDLCGDSYRSTGMTILNFTHPDTQRRRSLIIFPASVGSVRYRRLSVRLLLEGGESVRVGHRNFPV